jgi:hypothetical protein
LTVGVGGTLIFDPSMAGTPVVASTISAVPGTPALLIADAAALAIYRKRR